MAIVKISTTSANTLFFGDRDAKKAKRAARGILKQIWLDSAGVFAKSLAAEVLVETGESVGSLEPLARFTRVLLTFRSAPKKTKKGEPIKRPSLNPLTGQPIPGTRRSFRTGFKAGQRAFNFDFSSKKLIFEFSIPIFQFFLHETGRASNADIMVGAMARAQQAQIAFVRRQFSSQVGRLVAQWLATGKTEERNI